jgi:hypothetical protein
VAGRELVRMQRPAGRPQAEGKKSQERQQPQADPTAPRPGLIARLTRR